MKHRLLYDEAQELARTYGVHNITCGYMRDFKIDDERILEGKCSLTGKTCRRQIPIQIEYCVVYTEWLQKKLREEL